MKEEHGGLEALHIIPGGGFARELRSRLPAMGYHCAALYDDVPGPGQMPWASLPKEANLALAIGDSRQRQALFARLQGDYSYPSLIDPQALLQESASIRIGEGSIITAACILTCNIHIGRFNLINLHCSIGHDCRLADFVSLMPGVRLSGGVQVEAGAYLGTGAVVLPGRIIGAGATVGAGAVVSRDVAPNTVVKGVPAR